MIKECIDDRIEVILKKVQFIFQFIRNGCQVKLDNNHCSIHVFNENTKSNEVIDIFVDKQSGKLVCVNSQLVTIGYANGFPRELENLISKSDNFSSIYSGENLYWKYLDKLRMEFIKSRCLNIINPYAISNLIDGQAYLST